MSRSVKTRFGCADRQDISSMPQAKDDRLDSVPSVITKGLFEGARDIVQRDDQRCIAGFFKYSLRSGCSIPLFPCSEREVQYLEEHVDAPVPGG